jgi:hypothetical protein
MVSKFSDLLRTVLDKDKILCKSQMDRKKKIWHVHKLEVKTYYKTWAWWSMPVILALQRQRQ